MSVRFLIACREGHLTDFPWLEFVHKGNVPCQGAQLTLREYGASRDASDIVVECHSCGSSRRMADAFDTSTPFKCRGHAKLAVVDDVVLVSSANLTDDAFTRNLEVRARITDSDVVRWARHHFAV